MQDWFGYIFAILVVIVLIFCFSRDRARRKSLYRREDGVYVWIGFFGGECTSPEDPSAPGGAWDSGSDGDGGGDGGGD